MDAPTRARAPAARCASEPAAARRAWARAVPTSPLGEFLLKRITDSGLTQSEVARLCGRSNTAITEYIRGSKRPCASVRWKLRGVLRLDDETYVKWFAPITKFPVDKLGIPAFLAMEERLALGV